MFAPRKPLVRRRQRDGGQAVLAGTIRLAGGPPGGPDTRGSPSSASRGTSACAGTARRAAGRDVHSRYWHYVEPDELVLKAQERRRGSRPAPGRRQGHRSRTCRSRTSARCATSSSESTAQPRFLALLVPSSPRWPWRCRQSASRVDVLRRVATHGGDSASGWRSGRSASVFALVPRDGLALAPGGLATGPAGSLVVTRASPRCSSASRRLTGDLRHDGRRSAGGRAGRNADSGAPRDPGRPADGAEVGVALDPGEPGPYNHRRTNGQPARLI